MLYRKGIPSRPDERKRSSCREGKLQVLWLCADRGHITSRGPSRKIRTTRSICVNLVFHLLQFHYWLLVSLHRIFLLSEVLHVLKLTYIGIPSGIILSDSCPPRLLLRLLSPYCIQGGKTESFPSVSSPEKGLLSSARHHESQWPAF